MVKPLLATVPLAHLPADLGINVALYGDVKNTRYLRKQLIDQNRDFEYAFIDARKILSTTHLLAAVFRATNDKVNNRLKSHNVHSEIVLSLNVTNNIGDALRKFGISDQTSGLLVIKVSSQDPTEIAAQMEQAIEGSPLEFNNAELAKLHDLNDIRKAYKISAGATSKKTETPNSAEDEDSNRRQQDFADLEMSILGLMALRGAT